MKCLAIGLRLTLAASVALTLLAASGCGSGNSGKTEANNGGAARTGKHRQGGDDGTPPIANERPAWMAPGIPMVDRLDRISKDEKNLFQWFTLPAHIDSWHAALENEKDPAKQLDLRVKIGSAFLEIGKTEDGIAELQEAMKIIKDANLPVSSQPVKDARMWLGVGFLRQGEQDNCVARHTSESCILPVKGSGVYTVTRGPEAAVKHYEAMLADYPDDLGSRWLLNIANMNMGHWPDKVPAKWLVPPSAFESDYDIGHFTDIAPGVGLDVLSVSGGAVMEDLNGDGFQDIMVSSIGIRDQLRYFQNNGDGTFKEKTAEAGLAGQFGGLNLFHTDYNNDGRPDVYVVRGAWEGPRGAHPDSLLKNNGPVGPGGETTFTDVTEEAGLLDFAPSQAASWADFNNDGWIDLYVGEETAGEVKFPSRLYRNNGDGTFTEIAAEAGVQKIAFVKAVVWGDYDNDGLPDLYLSIQRGPNVLYHNDGPVAGAAPDKTGHVPWHFTDVTDKAGVAEPIMSFPTFWFDYDNDGWLDLFVCAYRGTDLDAMPMVVSDYLHLPVQIEGMHLYKNNRDGTFKDIAKEMHLQREVLGMSVNMVDLDNDGWLDFYVGTGNPQLWSLVPNRMFRNNEGKFFQDVTTSGGFGHLQKGHGIAVGDIDSDGDQDIYSQLGAAWPGDMAYNALFLNPGHGNHWITLQLEGVESNRAAVGARIKAVVATGKGKREIYVTAGTGGSFGASSLQQEIGLGGATSIERVEILWPRTGKTQILTGLAMDHLYKVREGELKASQVEAKHVPLTAGMAVTAVHHHPGMP